MTESHLRPVRSEERLVDRETLAGLLGCSTDTVDRMRKDGMPAIRWGGKLVRFRPSACMLWLEAQSRDEAA
jgi:excisionase family DNA binding protein